MGDTMFGEVSCDLHRCATYVRVSVPNPQGNCPMSIKATREGFARDLFKKGTVVEVEWSNHDGRRFRIVQVFERIGSFAKECPCNCPEIVEDRVSIYLSSRYWTEDWQRQRFGKVLMRAFDMRHHEAANLMDGGGFTVVCTATQFAKFMYERNEAGLVNGFLDLRMTLVDVPLSTCKTVDVTGR